MVPIKRSYLGESVCYGEYKVKFYNKEGQVTAKLYKGDSKLGKCNLDGLPVKSWEYDLLPKHAKEKIDSVLCKHMDSNLSQKSKSPKSNKMSDLSCIISPDSFPTQQPSIEILKSALVSLGYPVKQMEALDQKQQELPLLFVDTLFQHILSMDHFPKLDLSILDARDSRDFNLFLATVALGNEDKLKAILPYYKNKDGLHAKDSNKRNALHIASILGRVSLIPYLVEAGLKIDKKDKNGMAPIHLAIHEGNSDTVLALIKKGASLATPWTTSHNIQYYPLEMAVAAGNPAVVKALLDNDRLQQLNLYLSVYGIGNLLHLAIRTNQAPMLDYLLCAHAVDAKKLLNHLDPEGKTPLQLASYLGDLCAIRLLCQHGADLHYGTQEKGGTAVHYAAQGQQPNAICLLDWLGADLQSTDDRGRTPIILLEGIKTPLAKTCKGFLTSLPRLSRSEKTEPPNYTKRPPHNLVIQGGGPRGIAYLGALEVMEQKGTLSELKRVAGTSAGAITAAFLAVGCKSTDLRDLLNQSLAKFLDAVGDLEADLLHAAQHKSYQEMIQVLLKEYWEGWSTILHPIKRAQALKDKLSNLTGLASGEALREWIERVIQQQTGITYCTFGELKDLIDQNPDKYKELHIFSTRIKDNKSEVVHFSHEDSLWKDLIVSDAVRASLSIPGAFIPHVLHFKDGTGIRYKIDHHGRFLDGGLIRNFPLDAFDHEKYQEDRHFRGEKTNRRTLGLSLYDVTQHLEEETMTLASSPDLLKALINTYYNAEQILLDETGLYKDRTIVIPIKGIGLLSFDVSTEIKELNILSGREKTDSFFQMK
jgi:predicted acylesterase/phospholipase RssA/ankyrin repeat protein